MKIPGQAKAFIERGIRGGIAALVAVYVSGNLVFDTTHVSGSLEHIVVLFIGGAASALGLSVAGQAVSKNGPAFTRSERTTNAP